MKAIKFSLQIIAVFSLLILINSDDVSTQSNYYIIPMNKLTGEFKIDFENKIVNGSLIYNLKAIEKGDKIIFDTNKLKIKNIYKINDTTETWEIQNFTYGEYNQYLGTPLIIDLYFKKDEELQIKIEYETTSEGIAAQFLTPEKTFGKKYPYFYTQSKMILGRSLFPCQDTPAIKFKFDLKIIVPKDLRGMISGIYEGVSDYIDENYKVYSYKQENPIPSYLLSLAAGNIEEKTINDNITLYTEPEFIDKAYNEIHEEIPRALELAINYTGPFRWDKFNLLVLPKNFPYSGVENPNLVFLSPCVISDDKSLINIIIQTLMHHWAGNLVTNENWSDFWINGGIALFLTRKIMGILKNDIDLARMDGYVGMFYILFWIDYLEEAKKNLTSLHPPLEGKNPEEYLNDIPYEKGYNLIYTIEYHIGEEIMEQFFKEYFEHFKYQSIDLNTFKDYLFDFCKSKGVSEKLDKIDWNMWIYNPGFLPHLIIGENKYIKQTDEILEKLYYEKFDNLVDKFNNLPTVSKLYIFALISHDLDDFLTEKQHKFFTETLKLYENQNFLVTIHYLYMILKRTDKFLEHELDCLINILSNYGEKDYLVGIYQEFYKRDDDKAQETLNNLKDFYHPVMFNMAQEEINEVKKEFPILEINVKEDLFNIPKDVIALNVSKYSEDLGDLILTDNIYLVSESGQHSLICFLNSEESQYCKLKNITGFKNSGEYTLKVTERIQKKNYAVKVYESKKFNVNQLLDIEKMNKSYNFDYKDNTPFLITLYFLKESFDNISDIPAIFDNNNEFKLTYQRDEETCSYVYELNKKLIEKEYKINKEYTKFLINFFSKNGESLFDLDVNIKDSDKEENEAITDVSTCSNYKQISIKNISGEFKVDFDQKIITGDLYYNLKAKEDGNEIIFDTKALIINNVFQVIGDEHINIDFAFLIQDENLGLPLSIPVNYKKNDYIKIRILFTTTDKGDAAQFLNPEQTFGKKLPYLFTQSEMIIGRSLFPCQDTPAIKFKFDLKIIVPKELRGMLSGRYVGVSNFGDENYTAYNYKQDIPIPSYLLSIAVGNITQKKINDRISVFSEPEFIDKAYNETYEDLPKVLELMENYTGLPYEWGEYNILVLPRSFPFSGMENPCLSFLSPCLINGDKSLVDIIFHEMIHSWSGNLVTNEAWSDFWLNEGITNFLQRKMMGLLKNDKDYARMDGMNGRIYIKESIENFGEEGKEFTKLRPDMTGVNPDEVYSDIPYEKGYNFIYYIETLIGEDKLQKFFQNYFKDFKYQTINYFQFKNYFIKFCRNNEVDEQILQKINWTEWIFTPGDIPVKMEDNNNTYKIKADEIGNKIREERFDNNIISEYTNLPTISKLYIFIILSEKEGFLTEKQHKFFTENLTLYKNQNFLVSTNYFRFILKKTNKFLDHELDSLVDYLSNNGASDYMSGLYGAFYKRDEIKAVQTLRSLETFYHKLMYKMAEEEIEQAEKEFPIMQLDFSNDKKYYYPYEDNFDVIVSKYTDKLGQLNLDKNVYLVLDENTKFELNCIIKNTDSKYCKLKNIEDLKTTGKYSIKVIERIQELNYAVKVGESHKFDIIQFLDRSQSQTSYTFDLRKQDTLKISLKLNEIINFDLPAYFDNKKELKLKCALNNDNYECEINKTFCESNCIVDENGKKYQINFLSKSEEPYFKIEVLIQKSSGVNKTLAIVLPCVAAALIIIAIVVIFIIRKKRNTKLSSQEINKELVSVGFKDD